MNVDKDYTESFIGFTYFNISLRVKVITPFYVDYRTRIPNDLRE